MRLTAALLCAAGRHRPRGEVRWNQGYGFTACTRCGCDLVRSMLGGWQKPVGYRVVWRRATPPPPLPLNQRPLTAGRPHRAPAPSSPFDFSDFDDPTNAAPLPDRAAAPDRGGVRVGDATTMRS